MNTLAVALLRFPRIYALADDENEHIVTIERFLKPSIDYEVGLLENCLYALSVTNSKTFDESFFCRHYEELQSTLIVNVHGGPELAFGAHWTASISDFAFLEDL